MQNVKEFKSDYRDYFGENYNTVWDVVQDIIKKSMDSIWMSIEDIINHVKSGQYSNEDIVQKLLNLQEELWLQEMKQINYII